MSLNTVCDPLVPQIEITMYMIALNKMQSKYISPSLSLNIEAEILQCVIK